MAEGCVPAREKPVAHGASHTILQQNPHTHIHAHTVHVPHKPVLDREGCT